MTVSPAGIALIKEFEGCELMAYPDGNGKPTVGYGHTGPNVTLGMEITQDEADTLLAADLLTADRAVAVMCPNATQPQHDAFISLAYNIGVGNFRASTAARLHNVGDYAGAAKAFLFWNKVAGQVSAGLTRRRSAEAALYLSEPTGVTS